MSDFIRYNDISCIAAVEVYGGKSAAFRGKSTIFVEEEKAPFVQKNVEHPPLKNWCKMLCVKILLIKKKPEVY